MWSYDHSKNEAKLVKSIKVMEALENFTFVKHKGNLLVFAANGSYITVLEANEEKETLEVVATIHAF